MGVNLSRQTMSNWIISGARLLKPLYDALKIQADPKDYSTAAGQAFEIIERLFKAKK